MEKAALLGDCNESEEYLQIPKNISRGAELSLVNEELGTMLSSILQLQPHDSSDALRETEKVKSEMESLRTAHYELTASYQQAMKEVEEATNKLAVGEIDKQELETLKQEVETLKQKLVFQEPAIRIAEATRARFLVQTQTDSAGNHITSHRKADKEIIERGNDKVHNGDVDADFLMYKQIIMTAAEKKRFRALFMALYRFDPDAHPGFGSTLMKNIVNMRATMKSCWSWSQQTHNKAIDKQFGELFKRCEKLLVDTKERFHPNWEAVVAFDHFDQDPVALQMVGEMEKLTQSTRALHRSFLFQRQGAYPRRR